MNTELEKDVELEREHNPTYNKLKAFYDKHGKFPSKDEFFLWIVEDHSEEGYYKALRQMEKDLKKKETIKESEEVVETTPLEKLQETIDVRQSVEDLISSIEAVLLAPDITMISPEVNVVSRLSENLNSLRELRHDLEKYGLVGETPEPEVPVEEPIRSTEEDLQEETLVPKDGKELKTGDIKDLLFSDVQFKKEDVETILENNYRVVSKEEGLWKISTRNIFRENKESLFNYNLNVFFDNNILSVSPIHINEATEKLSDKILKEIFEDLEAIKGNHTIIDEEAPEVSLTDYDRDANLYANKLIKQYFLKEDAGLQILSEEVEESSKNPQEPNEGDNVRSVVTVYLKTEEVEEGGFTFESLMIEVEYDYIYNVDHSAGDQITPEHNTSFSSNEDSKVLTVYVDGSTIDLAPETEMLLNEINLTAFLKNQEFDL